MDYEEEYPTAEELLKIKDWPCEDVPGLVEYVISLWHWPDYALLHHDWYSLELHTGGWSGNEDIIEVLAETVFWMLCWSESKRGGHYYFEIPECARKKV